MFGMGGSEIIVILIVALLFLGPEKLPSAAKQISKGIRDIKKQSRALQQQIENDETIGGAIRDLKSALRGDESPPERKKKPRAKELPAPGEPTIHPGLAAEAEAAADPPEPVEARAGEPAAEPAIAADAADASDEAAPAEGDRPVIRLPVTAGEPDPEVPAHAADDDELAAMIKPATGTVAKGS